MFRKVLIANRGEIAVRIIRTLREMGITSVAVYSEADRDALFVESADEAYYLGPSPPADSYLNIDAILSLVRQAEVDAVHPGYGFLAENPEFAAAVVDSGFVFIGPSACAVRVMGNKAEARQLAQQLGVPVVPGTRQAVRDLGEALDFGRDAGYPVVVKAVAGGGGRGMRVVPSPAEMSQALEAASREAGVYFRNPEVYLERYFLQPRHVEIQVLGDQHGHLIHLGERDCSVQRRHQKLIEETPSPGVSRELRARMGEMAILLARGADYSNAGTVEFLVVGDSEFYFLEMNTRIQVEHPITELVSGVDLIREMILAASGEPISVTSEMLDPHGHAIEIRVNAEDPRRGFLPTPTAISEYREPGGIGVRVDSGVMQGYTIPAMYDSLMAKVIAWAPDREAARRRALRALAEYRIGGPATTIPFADAVLRHPTFIQGEVRTSFVTDHAAELEANMGTPVTPPATEAAAISRGDERTFEVEVNRKLFRVRVSELSEPPRPSERRTRVRAAPRQAPADALLSPMHGTVIAIRKRIGDAVAAGETVVVIEAMKMENEVRSSRDGTMRSLEVQVGETVDADQRLAVID